MPGRCVAAEAGPDIGQDPCDGVARRGPRHRRSASPPGAWWWTGSRRQAVSSAGQRRDDLGLGAPFPVALVQLGQVGIGGQRHLAAACRPDRRARVAARASGECQMPTGGPVGSGRAGGAAGPPGDAPRRRPGARRGATGAGRCCPGTGPRRPRSSRRDGPGRGRVADRPVSPGRSATGPGRPPRRGSLAAVSAGTASSSARIMKASERGSVRARYIALMLTSDSPRMRPTVPMVPGPVLVAGDEHVAGHGHVQPVLVEAHEARLAGGDGAADHGRRARQRQQRGVAAGVGRLALHEDDAARLGDAPRR